MNGGHDAGDACLVGGSGPPGIHLRKMSGRVLIFSLASLSRSLPRITQDGSFHSSSSKDKSKHVVTDHVIAPRIRIDLVRCLCSAHVHNEGE